MSSFALGYRCVEENCSFMWQLYIGTLITSCFDKLAEISLIATNNIKEGVANETISIKLTLSMATWSWMSLLSLWRTAVYQNLSKAFDTPSATALIVPNIKNHNNSISFSYQNVRRKTTFLKMINKWKKVYEASILKRTCPNILEYGDHISDFPTI